MTNYISKLTKEDVNSIRDDFPFLSSSSNETKPVHFLDSAASSQKPRAVLETMYHYGVHYANVHRGLYALSEKMTLAFEDARDLVCHFIGGVKREEVIFTSGCTESINLICRTWGEANVAQGDEILLAISEHHANIVPWQILADRVQAKVRFIPLNHEMRLDVDKAISMLNSRTKVLSLGHVSNVLGTIHPVKLMIKAAQKVGAIAVIDGAQAVPHLDIDVYDLGCDFYAFSGHKMLGPSGIGVLFGKRELLDAMPPFMGGGDMIRTVSTRGSTWNDLPYKFEAGTPPIIEAIGLGEAIRYLSTLDRKAIFNHEQELGKIAFERLAKNENIRLFSSPGKDWIGTIALLHDKIHAHDFAAFQDAQGVCVRAGHHCAQPLMDYLGVPATIRLSPYLYNNEEDIDRFFSALNEAQLVFC